MTEEEAPSRSVARYYDRNTSRFLLVGRGRRSYSIHRELWGPGVTSAREATEYVNRLVADEVGGLALGRPPTVLDFGCGVGGTLFHLAERFPGATLVGVTVSPRQVEIAARLSKRLGHASRCTFVRGDFQTVELGTRADAVVAVESLAHATDRDAFLANATRHLRAGGRLIVVDDFLSAEEEALDGRRRRLVDQLRAGWRAHGLGTLEALVGAAAARGLVPEKTVDLTHLVRPRSRVRDFVVAVVAPPLARLGLSGVPLFGNLTGGHAVQVGLSEGFLRYRLLVLRESG
ncbi:MAG TPA: methyltransferase [Longimicrobiales bacterium]|nr:methyltransferase [Longimicrobiales bacterium]